MTTVTPADTKRRAQAVALELFSTEGYDGTSMREIAERLGVTKAALYYHFAGKEDIVRSILDDYLARLDDLADWTRSTPAPEPEQVLLRWADMLRTDGLPVMRFLQSNQRIVRDLKFGGGSVRQQMEPIFAAIAQGDSVEAQVRARLAVYAVHGAGFFSIGLDAPDDEILDVAVRVALEILHG